MTDNKFGISGFVEDSPEVAIILGKIATDFQRGAVPGVQGEVGGDIVNRSESGNCEVVNKYLKGKRISESYTYLTMMRRFVPIR